MTANQATKNRIRNLCAERNIDVPACCDSDSEVTVEDVVMICQQLGISVVEFFRDSVFER